MLVVPKICQNMLNGNCENISIYANVEVLPIDNKWVRFSPKHIEYPNRFYSRTLFML